MLVCANGFIALFIHGKTGTRGMGISKTAVMNVGSARCSSRLDVVECRKGAEKKGEKKMRSEERAREKLEMCL